MNKEQSSQLHSISSQRLTLYTLLFSFIILGSISYTLFQKNHQWDLVAARLESITFLAKKEAIKKSESESIRRFYKKCNGHYLQKNLESLSFLQGEYEALINLLNAPGFCGNSNIENRITFLNTSLNQITLREQPLYTSSHFKEVEVELTHPVQVSLTDLEEILKIIEINDPAKPLLHLSHFHLNRIQSIDQNEVFEIHFKILKREFFDL